MTTDPIKSYESIGLGVFDGLHLGHQQIYQHADTLLTFYPHPDQVLGKTTQIHHLSTIDELGFLVPDLLVLPFSKAASKQSASEFLDHILKKISFKKLVVGYDFCFGYQQQGNSDLLEQWGNHHHIDIQIIDAYLNSQKQPIKSSQIRQSIINQQFNQAIQDLGHPYPLFGTVIKGDGKGKELGFPTANLSIHPDKLIPGHGVYAGHIIDESRSYKAMIYIGSKPTLKSTLTKTRTVEVHILNFSKDLYDKPLKVFLSAFIRPEQKFSCAAKLIDQIHKDIAQV